MGGRSGEDGDVTTRTFIIPVVAPPVGGIPAAGTFKEWSTNKPQDVFPTNDGSGFWGGQGPVSVWSQWTSGMYAPDLGASGSYICWGGGHGSYGGNEVYRCDIATRLWSRLGNPSPYAPANIDSVGAYPDGKPTPPHNYQTLGYLSPANGGGTSGSLIQATIPAAGQSGYGNGMRWWKFNFATQTWSQFINSSTIQFGSSSPPLMVQEPNSHFWWLGSAGMASITRVTVAGAITQYGIGRNPNTYSIGGCVGSTRILCDHHGYETWLYNLPNVEAGQTGATARKLISASGTPAGDSDSLTWVPDRNAFAAVRWQDARTVRWLTPLNAADPWNTSWSWTTETYTASGSVTVPASSGNGGYGRAVWCPPIKCLLWSGYSNQELLVIKPYGVS